MCDQLALAAVAAGLAILGVVTIAVKSWRLLDATESQGALVLTFVHSVTQAWWHGIPVYVLHYGGVVQPPPTWLLLWPVFGWTAENLARLLWAVAAVASLAALGFACARAVGNSRPMARACAWLAPFSMPALGDAVGIGSLITVLLPLAVWAVILAASVNPTWKRDLAAAGTFDLALADPALALPFFGTLLGASRRIRPAALAAAGYGILMVAAAYVHPTELVSEIRLWLDHVQGPSGHGYGNIQDWLSGAGWSRGFLPVSLLILGCLYVFSWRYRHSDVWLLLGIAAIVARLCVARRIDTDGLLIVPLMAMGGVLSSGAAPPASPWWKAVVIVSALVLWAPLQFHFEGSTIGPLTVGPTWSRAFDAAHVTVLLLMLVALTVRTIRTAPESGQFGISAASGSS